MLTWIFSFFGWCYKHKKQELWDGFGSYVCCECAKTKAYRDYLDSLDAENIG